MMTGTLYLCATPIGNLEDITIRALKILKEVDIIAAEDTRHSRKLLSFYDIHKQLTSYHEHNKKVKGQVLIEKILEGKNIALITDAGTPAISDPGSDLVRLAIESNIQIISLPGPSAFVTALTISGLPTNEFVFFGFLPTEKKHRRVKLEQVANEKRTIILYEAPHRIKKTLKELYSSLGDREIAIIRELTKKFEEVKRGFINEMIQYYDEVVPKGEFCIVIDGINDADIDIQNNQYEGTIEEQVFSLIEKGFDKKDAVKEVAKLRGIPKREVYNTIVRAEENVE